MSSKFIHAVPWVTIPFLPKLKNIPLYGNATFSKFIRQWVFPLFRQIFLSTDYSVGSLLSAAAPGGAQRWTRGTGSVRKSRYLRRKMTPGPLE